MTPGRNRLRDHRLAIEAILASRADPPPGRVLGLSREGRGIEGHHLGEGGLRVSLIGGCHADEPVGPALLRKLVAYLGHRPSKDPLLREVCWWIVPHVNPDGEARNGAWTDRTLAAGASRSSQRIYDLAAYIGHVQRELPGDDVEFGFPRDDDDGGGARPENRAVASFLAPGPFHLHGSFHGMGFATGPWFLIEPSWIERTSGLRQRLRERVAALGYRPFDVDRGGEKGFRRIDEGFSTRPDSGAMREFFLERGDAATAAAFRPSSMEYVRSLGGDPLTLVSEMPLFLLPPEDDGADPFPRPVGTEGRLRFHAWLARIAAAGGASELRRQARRHGIRAMPIGDQMRLQLAFLDEALATVARELAT